jgi:DNA-binding PadR family transcriptional regulator
MAYLWFLKRNIWNFDDLIMGTGEMGVGDSGPKGSLAASDETAGADDAVLSLSVWLVLALVIESPSHGYELYQRYELRFGGLSPRTKPSVYKVLRRLEDIEMIEPIMIESAGRPRRQHDSRRSYRATRKGAQAFRRWVAERMQDDPDRLGLLARVASICFLGAGAALEVIDRYESDCVQEMKALPASDPEGEHRGIAELVESLVVDQRRREVRARIDWAIHARRVLQAHAGRRAPGPPEGS